MNILITGAAGFVGRNLTAALENLQQNKDRTRPGLSVGELYRYDLDTDIALLEEYCAKADFVFHLAGVNRPQEQAEFMRGNCDFTEVMLSALQRCGNPCPVMLASSVQASLLGRFAQSDYGKSKRAGEQLVFEHAKKTGARVLVYRLPNLFGKWCRPHYNSVVATFCSQTAQNLPIRMDDERTELELVYIDDLLTELLDALEGKEHRCELDGMQTHPVENGSYCAVPVIHRVTLGELARLLQTFQAQPQTLVMPELAPGSFAKKLYSTYLSYLPRERVAFDLKMNADARGSFTELLKTERCGQFSVNISKPGITKGQHWHHSKWEFFIVVAGHGLIQERRIGSDEVLEFEVSGERLQAVHMLPGYTHNLINLSQTQELVTLMWANEPFDPEHPDTYGEPV